MGRYICSFSEGAGLVTILAYITILLAGFYGYVSNIVSIVHGLGGAIDTTFLVRCLGVFAFPLGAIMGFVG